jgi:hypothetical protein
VYRGVIFEARGQEVDADQIAPFMGAPGSPILTSFEMGIASAPSHTSPPHPFEHESLLRNEACLLRETQTSGPLSTALTASALAPLPISHNVPSWAALCQDAARQASGGDWLLSACKRAETDSVSSACLVRPQS